MSVIKQLATYNGSAWTTDDIGANASNVALTTNVAGQSNVQSALSKLCGTAALTGSRMVVTNSSGVLTTSTPTANRVLVSAASTGIPTASAITNTELSYLSGATSNIQTQINTLNNNLGTANTNIGNLTTELSKIDVIQDVYLTRSSVSINNQGAGTVTFSALPSTMDLYDGNMFWIVTTTYSAGLGPGINVLLQASGSNSGNIYVRSGSSFPVAGDYLFLFIFILRKTS